LRREHSREKGDADSFLDEFFPGEDTEVETGRGSDLPIRSLVTRRSAGPPDELTEAVLALGRGREGTSPHQRAAHLADQVSARVARETRLTPQELQYELDFLARTGGFGASRDRARFAE
jgi:hypothetical protein